MGEREEGSIVFDYPGREIPAALKKRGRLMWIKCEPGAETWSEPRTFYDGKNRNSYPSLTRRDGGGWHAVWDSSWEMDRTRTRICYGRFDCRR